MEKVAVSLGFGVCSLPAGNRAVGGGDAADGPASGSMIETPEQGTSQRDAAVSVWCHLGAITPDEGHWY